MRRIASRITLAFCVPVLVLSLFPMYLFFVIAGLFGERARTLASTAVFFLWNRLAVFATLSTVSVHGRDRLPRGEPFVIYCNHSSFFDIPILSGFVVPRATYAARKGLLIAPLIRSSGGVILERRKSRSELKNVREIVRKVKAGRPFIVFPEGTRSVTGEVGDLKSGSLKIAKWAGAFAVPVRIEGARRLLPRGAKWPAAADVRVHIGQPFAPEELSRNSVGVLDAMKDFFEGKRIEERKI